MKYKNNEYVYEDLINPKDISFSELILLVFMCIYLSLAIFLEDINFKIFRK